MNKEEAQQHFQKLVDLEIENAAVSLCVGTIQATTDGIEPQLFRLQLTEALAGTFREVAKGRVESWRDDLQGGDLALRRYQVQSKPETFEVEYIETEKVPGATGTLGALEDLAELPILEPGSDFAPKWYVIALQHPEAGRITFFRVMSRKKILWKSKLFGAIFENGHFDKISDAAMLFDGDIDCVEFDGSIFVARSGNFQRIFSYFALVQRLAEDALEAIKGTVPIENFDAFADACRGHQQKMAKLRSISQKPYLADLAFKDLRRVIEEFGLEVKTAKVDGKDALVFDPADKWAILRLLDDDYLGSVMTEEKYEVTGKRPHE